VPDWSDEETDNLLCGRPQFLQGREVDEGRCEGRSPTIAGNLEKAPTKHWVSAGAPVCSWDIRPKMSQPELLSRFVSASLTAGNERRAIVGRWRLLRAQSTTKRPFVPSRRLLTEEPKAQIDRKCAECGKGFTVAYRQPPATRFCSPKCRVAFHNKLTKSKWRQLFNFYGWQGERRCDRCGAAYYPKRRNQRFCGPDCK
jgi:hypothetical protein